MFEYLYEQIKATGSQVDKLRVAGRDSRHLISMSVTRPRTSCRSLWLGAALDLTGQGSRNPVTSRRQGSGPGAKSSEPVSAPAAGAPAAPKRLEYRLDLSSGSMPRLTSDFVTLAQFCNVRNDASPRAGCGPTAVNPLPARVMLMMSLRSLRIPSLDLLWPPSPSSIWSDLSVASRALHLPSFSFRGARW
jgi:hypothetical protein